MEKYKVPQSYAENSKNNQQDPEKQNCTNSDAEKKQNIEITYNIAA